MWRTRAIRSVLNFPIFYKILIASTFLVITGLAAGFWLGSNYDPGMTLETVRWLQAAALAGVAVFTALNYFIVRAALQPVSMLSELVAALRSGDTNVQVEPPLFGDWQSTLLVQTSNQLLGELTAYRRQAEWLSQLTTEHLENERRNIARELHDETAQNLVALLVLLQMVHRAPTEEARREALGEARELARTTLEGVRRISAGLRPILLDDLGLFDALQWYVNELMGSVLPPVALNLNPDVGRLSPVKELALYRISQEALSNIARHSHAQEASLSLSREGAEVVLRIADGGDGFDTVDTPRNAGQKEHFGLFTIKERARLAGGVASITSQPGKGTVVVARIPARDGRPASGERK